MAVSADHMKETKDMTTIDPATSDMLRRAGISPQAWQRFAAAEAAALRKDHEARTTARRGRPPVRATLGDISAAVARARRAPATVADALAAVAALVYGRKVAA
jgi:hypothetical protein